MVLTSLQKAKNKLKEKTGKGLIANKPKEIKKAFSGTCASKGLTRVALKERKRLMNKRYR